MTVLVLPLLVAIGSEIAAAREPACERVGREGGPPSEVITAVLRDRAGFLWLGASDGLTRFDGYSFTRFRHDPSDPGSLSENSIRTIMEDSKGTLWIGTN